MVIEHLPDIGIVIDTVELRWGFSREKNRQLLNCDFEATDEQFDIGAAEPLIVKKDNYRFTLKSELWFVLIYDEKDTLQEFELHSANSFHVKNTSFLFLDSITAVRQKLSNLGLSIQALENTADNVLVASIKTNFASAKAMGGEGDALGYIYCANNIEHLMD